MYTGLPDQYGLTADNAVVATTGEVLYCSAGSACGPAGTVALAEYSASTGGYTSGGAFPAVPDLGDAVPANPVHSWSVQVPDSQIESAFSSIGALEQVEVTERNGLGQIGGRVEELQVVGDDGFVQLTGDQFAADFALRSDWFEIGGAPLTAPTTSTTVPPTTTTTTAPPISATTTTTTGPIGVAPPGPSLGPDNGYWVVDSQGDVATFGAATSYGTAAGTSLQGIVRGMVATPDYRGYWMVGRNGGVLAFGDASWYGSASKLHLAKPVVGMAATPDGEGYWLVASDGGIFAFGDAGFYGSTGQLHLNKPIVGIAATPDGGGYWLVASDGGVFAFGDAHFYGSVGHHRRLNEAVTGIVPSADGKGYFIVAKDGGVFAFGDARFLGSLPSERISARVAAVAPTYDDAGYFVLATSGRVYSFGDATIAAQLGAAGTTSLPGKAVAIVCHRSVVQSAHVRETHKSH
jgi:hypothetical protein